MATVKQAGKTIGAPGEYATFHVGGILLGIPIQQVEEINRLLDVTQVPHSPEYVCGVVNLRGEVVTILDLRSILGLEPLDITATSRNVVVHHRGERVGLLVDSIGDVVRAQAQEMETPPANIHGLERQFFTGVCKLEQQLLVLLDIEQVLVRDTISN